MQHRTLHQNVTFTF